MEKRHSGYYRAIKGVRIERGSLHRQAFDKESQTYIYHDVGG
jgi:hypothetical protein